MVMMAQYSWNGYNPSRPLSLSPLEKFRVFELPDDIKKRAAVAEA
jgi:hypothetical protein